jgi:hypothetical protein
VEEAAWLAGLPLAAAAGRPKEAHIGDLLDADAGLCLVLASFNRLIEQARTSLEGKVNIFDQYLINNFNFLGRRNSRRLL